MITKENLSKKSSKEMSSQPASTSSNRQGLRAKKQNPPKKNGAIHLSRLNTQQFDELLDEVDDSEDREVLDSSEDNTPLESLRKNDDLLLNNSKAKSTKKNEKVKNSSVLTGNGKIARSSNIYSDATDQPDTVSVDIGESNKEGEVSKMQTEESTTGLEGLEEKRNTATAKISEKKGNEPLIVEQPRIDSQEQPSYSLDKETQTAPVSVLCGCTRCRAILCDFVFFLEKHLDSSSREGICKQTLSLDTPATSDENNKGQKSAEGTLNEDKEIVEEMVPLVKGSKVMVSIVAKANLKLDNPDGDPQKILNCLMEIFFTNDEMYNMTCVGQGVGSKGLPKDVAQAFKAYIHYKYNSKKFCFDSELFTKFVNNKCYLARKAIWKKNPALKEERALQLAQRKASTDKVDAPARIRRTPKSAPSKYRRISEESTPSHSRERPKTGSKRPRSTFEETYSEYMRNKYTSASSKGAKKQLLFSAKSDKKHSPSPLKKRRAAEFISSPLKQQSSSSSHKTPTKISEFDETRPLMMSTPKADKSSSRGNGEERRYKRVSGKSQSSAHHRGNRPHSSNSQRHHHKRTEYERPSSSESEFNPASGEDSESEDNES